MIAALLLLSLAVFTDVLHHGASSPSDSDLADAAVDFQDGDAASQAGRLFSTSAPIESYYFQANIEADDDDVLSTVRAWYEKPDRWRFEFGDFTHTIPGDGSLQASDGETVWFYEAGTNTYSQQQVADYFGTMPPEFRDAPLFLPTSLLIGPLPTTDPGGFLSSYTATWTLKEHADGGKIAGRPTDMYRYSIPGSGEVSLWLDREYPLVLRLELNNPESPQSHLSIEIADLAVNQPIDAARFGFEPPVKRCRGSRRGWRPRTSYGYGQSGPMGGQFDAPAGFYNPVYLPDGYTITGTEASTSSVRPEAIAEYIVHLENAGARLDIEQRYRAGGLDPSQQQGEPVAIGDTTGYQRTEGDDLLLVWSQGDTIITLRADQLRLEELVRVAESMQ